MTVDITLLSPTLPSPTLHPIDETDEPMVDLVLELGAFLAKRTRAPRTHKVLHPSTPSAPSTAFEIAQDLIDQPTVYFRRRPKRNIKPSS